MELPSWSLKPRRVDAQMHSMQFVWSLEATLFCSHSLAAAKPTLSLYPVFDLPVVNPSRAGGWARAPRRGDTLDRDLDSRV